MEDWADQLPPKMRRQLARDVCSLDSTPPPSTEHALYTEESQHSEELLLEPLSERGEDTPIGWMSRLPPPLPEPS